MFLFTKTSDLHWVICLHCKVSGAFFIIIYFYLSEILVCMVKIVICTVPTGSLFPPNHAFFKDFIRGTKFNHCYKNRQRKLNKKYSHVKLQYEKRKEKKILETDD